MNTGDSINNNNIGIFWNNLRLCSLNKIKKKDKVKMPNKNGSSLEAKLLPNNFPNPANKK